MRYLVTGGAGFIGSHLANKLAETHEVWVVDKLTYAADVSNLKTDRVKLLVGDICSPTHMNDLFDRVKPDVVFHLAAESHVDNSLASPNVFIETNVHGTVALLQAATMLNKKKPVKFIHISTDEVFGHLTSTNESPFTESSPINPRSPYSASKASSDLMAFAWHTSFDLPVIVTNCSNNYGPNQHKEKLIPTIIRNAINGTPVPVYGTGTNIRDWLYVEDHVDALIQIGSLGDIGERYCIGGGTEMTNLEMVKRIGEVLGITPEIKFVADRKGHDFRYAINSSKMESLGWKPKTTIESGLVQTVNFYKEKFTK